MHVLDSWDIKAESPQWEELNEELRVCLEDYSWVKPLSTLYIVQIEDAHDLLNVKQSLTEVWRDHPNMVHFSDGPTDIRAAVTTGGSPNLCGIRDPQARGRSGMTKDRVEQIAVAQDLWQAYKRHKQLRE